ncbi:hypothetical protein HN682_08525, partial [Candidatus Peregrinibacteria bacterium]|nr:hypothetical protein [Candidatus Peregrinibacteria bacterium]
MSFIARILSGIVIALSTFVAIVLFAFISFLQPIDKEGTTKRDVPRSNTNNISLASPEAISRLSVLPWYKKEKSL